MRTLLMVTVGRVAGLPSMSRFVLSTAARSLLLIPSSMRVSVAVSRMVLHLADISVAVPSTATSLSFDLV